MSQPYFDSTAAAPSAPRFIPFHEGDEDGTPAVSWGAIAAGAFASAALALILLALGAGAGLSSLSPWATSRVMPSTVGVAALVWLVVIELVASALGGYLAGRLRTKWIGVHTHEVYFRDTAHGFLAWAVALVITAGFLTTAATAMVGGETRMEASNDAPASARYFVDRLFRSEQPMVLADSSIRAEAGAVFAHGLRERALSDDDKSYLSYTVSSRTGMSRTDAATRVNGTFAAAQDALDNARKAAAHALYWLFVALLIGAFSASVAATLGGRRRDYVYTA